MKLKYSICYPDREEIDYFNDPISEKEVLPLINNFDWERELKKELLFYAPSLDFIKLDDKLRIIVSGIGKGKLGLVLLDVWRIKFVFFDWNNNF